MLKTKLCEAFIRFSSVKRKNDSIRFVCLSESDFFNNIDEVKNHICSKYGLEEIRINSINFTYLEVLE